MTVSRILVGIDDSKESETALRAAVEEAKLRGAALEITSVYPPANGAAAFPAMPSEGRGDVERRRHEHAEQLIQGALERLGESLDDIEVEIRPVKNARSSSALIQRSKEVELVVVGHRGRGGFRGLRLGSTSEQVIRHAHCSVLVVRESQR